MDLERSHKTDHFLVRPEGRTADALVEILVDSGVEVVFGLPGGPISPLHDALLDRPEVRVVTTRHESGALFAAAGYAHTTGRLGVALVTSGPGALNAMTGLASAYCDGLPLLLLVGEVPRRTFGKGALQDGSAYHLNIVAMASNISKLAVELHDPNAAPLLFRRAIATARSGRPGPVVLTLPMDVSTAHIAIPEVALDVSTRYAIAPRALERAEMLLTQSEKPALLVGAGVRSGDGPAQLLRFAERLQCPVATTPKGKGIFPENHPLSCGVFGMGGHPSARDLFTAGVDVLLAVGTSLGDLATDGWSPILKPQHALIHVDIEAAQIGRSYPASLAIAAPAELFFDQMIERLPQRTASARSGIHYHDELASLAHGDEGRISPQRALLELQERLPADTIFTIDSGEHFLFAVHFLRAHLPDSFVAMTGLGSMGSSIGAAIGAQLAHPQRSVAAICGDGCFAMNAFEVATATAERLPICVFVFNDARLGMVELGHQAVYGRSPTYDTRPMDVVQLARGLGAEALAVERPGQLLEALLLPRRPNRPLVVDVQIDRTVRMPKRDRFDAFSQPPKILN